MRIMNWVGVEESAPFQQLPPGGYVARIVDVEDVEDREYLNVVYDIAEGDWTGFYSDDFGRNNPWKHRFVRSYKESALGMFKAFLLRLEESNRDFNIAQWQVYSDPRQLVGLELGIVVQTELYTNDRGEDKERLNVVGVYASQDVRTGDYRLPEPKDARKTVGALEPAVPAAAAPMPAAAASAAWQAPAAPSGGRGAYDDLPFR